MNPDELYKPFLNIYLQAIHYLDTRFPLFYEKPLSDFEVLNFKCKPNDLTGYEKNNIDSLGIYYFNHRYLSKEEKEKIFDEWPEF